MSKEKDDILILKALGFIDEEILALEYLANRQEKGIYMGAWVKSPDVAREQLFKLYTRKKPASITAEEYFAICKISEEYLGNIREIFLLGNKISSSQKGKKGWSKRYSSGEGFIFSRLNGEDALLYSLHMTRSSWTNYKISSLRPLNAPESFLEQERSQLAISGISQSFLLEEDRIHPVLSHYILSDPQQPTKDRQFAIQEFNTAMDELAMLHEDLVGIA